jgi:hypothetical protein
MAFMTLLFIVVAGSVVAVRKMRIPYQIKQIDRALKKIEKGKTAKVEKIKTMGMVIAELLTPGLAELDIAAPVIESGPEDTYEDILGDDTEDLLGELGALDDVGADSASDKEQDFGAELEAELQSMAEEDAAVSVEAETIEKETAVSEPKPEAELEFEEMEPELETEQEKVPDKAKAEEIAPTSEPEAAEVEKPEVTDHSEPPIKPEEAEPEDAESDISLDEEVDFDKVDDSESKPEVESIETEQIDTKSLSKNEMIELLPPEIKERYSEQDLRKLSKRELQELLDYMDEANEE